MKTPDGFNITYVFLAYVPPSNGEDVELQTEIIKKTSRTTDYLFKIFDSAINEARIEILFNSDNKKNNGIRDHILSIGMKQDNKQKNPHAKKLAEHLHRVTDERSGTGLLAIIQGEKAKTTRIVVSRFKGDEGLYSKGSTLLIDYISEVFTKKSNHYKLAVYEDILSTASFWKGYAIDKQISSNTYKQISFFWVENFLHSKTALTPAQGTLQFSKIIKTILSKTSDTAEQEEIISGIVNLRTKKDVQISVADFCRTYLSEKVTNKIKDEMSNDDFYNSVFAIDPQIYSKELGKTVLTLQNGITAFVPSFTYQNHVTETLNNDGTKNVRIEGKLKAKKINVEKKEKQKATK
jgi:hypothetical protein